MRREKRWCWALLWICACSDKAAPAAPSSPAATETQAAPAVPPPTSAATEPNPCDNPKPITLELNAGTTATTPWNLEFRYAIDDDKKLGPGYMFQLRSGERRWETRRDDRNWNRSLTWRGFCWRGDERPAKRSSQLKILVGPVCQDGKLQELGGCGTTFTAP